MTEVFFERKFQKITKFGIEKMKNCRISGPALLMSNTASIFVKPLWEATILNGSIKLSKIKSN